MVYKKTNNKLFGSTLLVIGFLLSPLSWWNDLIVNLPIAYVFASLISLINSKLFAGSLLICYWVTNIIGLILVHQGVCNLFTKWHKKYRKQDFIKDILFSFFYSCLVVIFIILGWLKSPF